MKDASKAADDLILEQCVWLCDLILLQTNTLTEVYRSVYFKAIIGICSYIGHTSFCLQCDWHLQKPHLLVPILWLTATEATLPSTFTVSFIYYISHASFHLHCVWQLQRPRLLPPSLCLTTTKAMPLSSFTVTDSYKGHTSFCLHCVWQLQRPHFLLPLLWLTATGHAPFHLHWDWQLQRHFHCLTATTVAMPLSAFTVWQLQRPHLLLPSLWLIAT